jgi:predicted nucleotidyltransferase
MAPSFPKPTLLSAHPVSDAMRETVLGVLADVEARHDVRVLFACESGSRAWGFASPDSDYDVRFIYAHRLPWYLTVEPQRDVIEQPISGELDVGGWELRKALQLLRQSNPVLVEWLHSPIVYREEAAVMARFRGLAETGFSVLRGYHHYLSMARRNCREHLRGDPVRFKKYFYVLRPLLAARWIRERGGAPPMRFAELAETLLCAPGDAGLVAEINRLLEVKMRSGEAASGPPWPLLQAFIEAELRVAEANPPAAPPPRHDELDAFLHEVLTGGV